VTPLQRTPAQAVALTRLPEALRALWQQCRRGDPEGSISRSLIANFVGVAEAGGAVQLATVLDCLLQRLPCRAFLVTVDPAQPQIQATVCGASRGRGANCELLLEQIELRTSWPAFEKVAGLVRPLLANDLPTHLFWAAGGPESPRHFAVLRELADHVVVDSAAFGAPAADLLSVDQGARADHLTDLSWLRLKPWRRALAEAFERFTWNARLPTTVTLRHGHTPGAVAKARLLGRWLEQKVLATVSRDDRGDGPGLDSVELRHGEVLVTAQATAAGRIEVHVATAESCFLPFELPASNGSVGDLLAAAIDLA